MNLVVDQLVPRKRPEPGTQYTEQDCLWFRLAFSNRGVNRIGSRPVDSRTRFQSSLPFQMSFF